MLSLLRRIVVQEKLKYATKPYSFVDALIDIPLLVSVMVYTNLIALMSVGFSLTYTTSKIPNFAHGSFVIIGTYVTYHLTKVMRIVPNPIPTYTVVLISFLLTGSATLFVYVFVIGGLRRLGIGLIGVTISTIAIEFIISSFIRVYLTSFPLWGGYFMGIFMLRDIDFSFMGLPGILYASTLLSITIVTMLHTILTKTRFGIAMRSVIENASLSAVFGVDVEQLQRVSWFLSGGLAGLSGSVLPLWFTCEPITGYRLLLTVFAASIFGGLSSIYGVIAGSYAVGFLEILGTKFLIYVLGSWVAPYRLLIPLLTMNLCFIVAPNGIVGMLESSRIKHVCSRIFRWKPWQS